MVIVIHNKGIVGYSMIWYGIWRLWLARKGYRETYRDRVDHLLGSGDGVWVSLQD